MPTNDESPSRAPVARVKRSQVSRACDWCRLNRIKCDDHQPCKNCQARGGDCSNRRKDIRSLPAANREIERLRLRVSELEGELKNHTERGSPLLQSQNGSSVLSFIKGARRDYQPNLLLLDGIWVADPRTNNTHYYGPSSSLYFIQQMHGKFKETIQQPDSEDVFLPIIATSTFTTSSDSFKKPLNEETFLRGSPLDSEDLSRSQEEQFLGLFWQLYYCTVPILDGHQFQEHYNSLWSFQIPSATSQRAPSALIDIVLALCMQYGNSTVARHDLLMDVDENDTHTGGLWFYHRCQVLLLDARASPTLSTLQCHIYSAVFLWNSSLRTLAHEALAVAIRTAYMLGLHQNSSIHLSEAQQELYHRIWCTLFILESKFSLHLGRPTLIFLPDMLGELSKKDKAGPKTLHTSEGFVYDRLTYLEYQLQSAKLMLVVQQTYSAFSDEYIELMTINEGKSLYEISTALETSAKILSDRMKALHDWSQSVPSVLSNSRKENADHFSTSPAALHMDLSAPLWLQRQRILLELLYHNMAMTLYRPFIKSVSGSMALTPVSDSNRHCCLTHAIATTNIIYQVLTESTFINGLYDVFHYQWEASISMLGFSIFRPICPMASDTRAAIQKAIKNLQILGANNFPTAKKAAQALRIVSETIGFHTNNFRNPLNRSSETPSVSSSSTHQQNDSPMIDQLAMVQLKNADLRNPLNPIIGSSMPNTAEEFTTRMKTGFRNHSTSWLTGAALDGDATGTNFESWVDWLDDQPRV